MSVKSARNGTRRINGAPPAPPAPPTADGAVADPKPRSIGSRVDILEREIAQLKEELSQASSILVSMVENQAVQASMPAIEQQLRSNIQQAYRERGLAALAPQQQAPPPPQGA